MYYRSLRPKNRFLDRKNKNVEKFLMGGNYEKVPKRLRILEK